MPQLPPHAAGRPSRGLQRLNPAGLSARGAACLIALAPFVGPTGFLAAQSPRLAVPALDDKVLRDHQVGTQAPELLAFFRQRTPGPAIVRQFQELLAHCASDSYDERAVAAEELAAMGVGIRPLLQRVVRQPPADREVLHRAATTLAALPDDRDSALAMAAARLLAQQKPAGAPAVFLGYLPFAPDELVRQEVQLALNALTAAGQSESLLRAALKETDPCTRAAAGEALVRAGHAKGPAAALLRDGHPRVRLQVGLALVETGDRTAVPVLIELLAVLPPDLVWSAQELLLRLADADTALPVVIAGQPRRRVADAWAKWWQEHGAAVDVAAALAGKRTGPEHTVISHSTNGLNGKVVALGRDKQPIWQIEGLRYPVDVQLLSSQRVLIVEYLGRRVTERDLKGTILWEKAVHLPIAAQRLAGGLTFIACRNQLLVVDRNGQTVSTWRQPGPSIVAAQKLRDGHTVVTCAGGTCRVLDPEGRELKSFRVGQLYTMGSSLEVLPAGRILVPLYSENRIVEYDFDGNVLWKATVDRPTSATRLANGNTLVVSHVQNRTIEITPDGKEVWSYVSPGRPWRARR